MIKVTIYNEYLHEQTEPAIKNVYPKGIHGALQQNLTDDEISIIATVTADTIELLTDELLKNTDVLLWWGHIGHDRVPDEIAKRVQYRTLCGMGMIFLHSGHHSKPFKLLMGTSCNLQWREQGDSELVWVVDPSHPIAKGIDRYFRLEHEETYSEPFSIPKPEELVFIGRYSGGEVFRSGCCYKREYGKIFYFQPGHESFPTYYNPDVIKVLKNAIHWAVADVRVEDLTCPMIEPLGEDIIK